MPPALHSLDAFLAAPDRQRDATRAIRAVLARTRALTLVFGDEPAAAALVATLARTLPGDAMNGALLETAPVQLVMRPWQADAAPRPLPDMTAAQVLLSLLRQDPDVIALTTVHADTAPLVLQAMFTGHQMLLGCGAPSLAAAVAQLVGSEAHLQPHVIQQLDLAIELRGGRIHRVFRGEQLLVELDGDRCVLRRELLPPPAADRPLYEARFAPPLADRRPAIRSPRTAYLPVTGSAANDRSALATPFAWRPAGSTWPGCRGCAAPLAHVVTLDLATLPGLPRRGAGLAQLFVCSDGCETATERDPGVLAEILRDGALQRIDAPPLRVEVLQPGPIVQWLSFAEEPLPGDDEPLDSGEDGEDRRPLRGDKLFGWPAWEQGEAWPLDERGERHELLFQFAEGTLLQGGREPGWDFDRAESLPGEAAVPVLDPNRPQHIRSLLTGEAIGLLFVNRAGDRLAFRWQTG
jgi:hypothetical protein